MFRFLIMKYFSHLVKMLFVFILFTLSPCLINGLGRHNFECPDGFYLNIVNSIYGSDHRMYSFGCAPLTNGEINNEKCEPGKISATNSNDMYMTCDDNQYISGLSIVEDSTHQMWSLLCCQSPDVLLSNECSSTVFLNQYQKSFSFASGAKHVLRKWQSVYDAQKKDRRWWLQTCPFSIAKSSKNDHINNQTGSVMNFKRKVAFPFDSNRIDVRLTQKNFSKEHSIDDKPELKKVIKTVNDSQIIQTNLTTTVTKMVTSLLTHFSNESSQSLSTIKQESNTPQTFSWLQLSTVLASKLSFTSASTLLPVQQNATLSSISVTKNLPTSTLVKTTNSPNISSSTSSSLSTMAPSKNSILANITVSKNDSFGEKTSSYDDYYGTSIQNEKQSKINDNKTDSKLESIFKGLHKVFKNIQDGLVLAQWVLSNNEEETPALTSTTAKSLKITPKSPTEKFPLNKDEKAKRGIENGKSVLQNFAQVLGINRSSK